jgi:hypothetical protein
MASGTIDQVRGRQARIAYNPATFQIASCRIWVIDRSIPTTDEAMSPLRRRMIEDMTIRKFAPKTQHDYVQKIKNFASKAASDTK